MLTSVIFYFSCFYASTTSRCVRGIMFSGCPSVECVRVCIDPCIWECILLCYFINQVTEFHQTLVDDVVEVTYELIWFWNLWGHVKVTTAWYIWVSYCRERRHPRWCFLCSYQGSCFLHLVKFGWFLLCRSGIYFRTRLEHWQEMSWNFENAVLLELFMGMIFVFFIIMLWLMTILLKH